MAQRAQLIAQEETTFTDTVNAYVGVFRRSSSLPLNINNERVLARQLQATNDRFRVGEITRTDVAQAEAALAGATAQRQTSEGNLATARATYRRVIGYLPPGDLVEPQPLKLPIRDEGQAVTLASSNNPNVIAAQFNEAAAKDAVDVAFSALMPQLSLQGQTFQQNNTLIPHSQAERVSGPRNALGTPLPRWRGILGRAAGPADRNSRPASSWMTRAAPRSSRRSSPGKRSSPPAPRSIARDPRSAPTRSPWKAWSGRRSSAAAPRRMC